MGAPRTTGYQAGRTGQKSAPAGVKIICVLGAIGAFFSFLASIALLGTPLTVLGLVGIGLSFAQVVVLVRLWNVQQSGWKWGIVLFSVSGILGLLGEQVFSFFLSLVIVAYLLTKKDYYYS